MRFGCVLRGDPDRRIRAAAALTGGPDTIGFVANPAYLESLATARLGAVIIEPRHADRCPQDALLHRNPHATFARVAALLHPPPPRRPGVHAQAVVHPSAQVDATAEVGPFVVIGAAARIAARCRIAAHAVVGEGVELGADSVLLERVTVCAGSRIGARCIIHPGAVIGADGFGNARDGEG